MTEPGSNGREWFLKAEDDLISASALLSRHEGVPSTVCFLSQQVAEKYLKGLLVYHQQPFPKVHDLLRLETLLMQKVPDISQCHESLLLLNRYYIETRYPGDYPEFSWQEAHAAFAGATQVKEFVLARVGP